LIKKPLENTTRHSPTRGNVRRQVANSRIARFQQRGGTRHSKKREFAWEFYYDGEGFTKANGSSIVITVSNGKRSNELQKRSEGWPP